MLAVAESQWQSVDRPPQDCFAIYGKVMVARQREPMLAPLRIVARVGIMAAC